MPRWHRRCRLVSDSVRGFSDRCPATRRYSRKQHRARWYSGTLAASAFRQKSCQNCSCSGLPARTSPHHFSEHKKRATLHGEKVHPHWRRLFPSAGKIFVEFPHYTHCLPCQDHPAYATRNGSFNQTSFNSYGEVRNAGPQRPVPQHLGMFGRHNHTQNVKESRNETRLFSPGRRGAWRYGDDR